MYQARERKNMTKIRVYVELSNGPTRSATAVYSTHTETPVSDLELSPSAREAMRLALDYLGVHLPEVEYEEK
jgi:hypothetical protein